MLFNPLELGLAVLAVVLLTGAAAFVAGRRTRRPEAPSARAALAEPPDEDAYRDQLELRLGAMEEGARERARRTLLTAMERESVPLVADAAQVAVPLASEDLKGRIIGREGRNLRAFEAATGVELLIEEHVPEVTVSCLDPVRREIARRTLAELLAEGKIQPARIEEVHARVRASFERELPEIGRDAARRAQVAGLPPSVLAPLGALRFRASASQNVLEHSVECAHLAAHLAAEVGADPDAARRAALLHDLGKALGAEWPGPHALAGGALLRSAGESEAVCHAVEAHHGDVDPATAEAAVVRVADALSGARPGARKQDAGAFFERVAALEALARAEPGVADAYAIRAGRELRVIVRPESLDDEGARALARSLAARLGAQPEFRGPVDVVVVRESRHRATAEGEVP